MGESEFQRKCSELVDREVYANISWLLRTIMAVRYETEDLSALDLPFDCNDVQAACEALERAEVEVPEMLHDRYSSWLTLERSTLEELREELEEQRDKYVDEADEIECALDDAEDGDEEAIKILHSRGWQVAQLRDAYEELLSSIDDADWDDREVYEAWIVSRWFADRLRDQGEAVIDAGYAGQFWLRCTTGQAISMDCSVRDIAKGLYACDLPTN